MAYQVKDQKILPAGINLLAPGDQVAPGDCLDLTGCWPGAMGRLQQTLGCGAISAGHLGVRFDSLCEGSGRTYYGGAGNLYQVGRGAGEPAIDAGYDGYPLGMLSYQGHQWIMNRAKQRRDNGTTVSDWTPPPPGSPVITNPVLTSPVLAVSECDPAGPGDGGYFTRINLFTAASIADLEVGGRVTIAGNASAAMNSDWSIQAIYTGSLNLVVLEASLVPGTVFGLGGTFTFSPAGVVQGDHEYCITWQFADLGESNPSPSTTVGVSSFGQKVVVNIGALTPPAGVTGWNVYRKSPAMAWPYRVNEAVILIAATTFDDFGDAHHNQDDEYLTATLAAQLEGDHDAAPPARIMANQVYNGRIVVANSAAYPNRVWYTPALQPGFFRGSGNPQAGDWVDVGTDRGDEILFVSVKPNQIIVYRAKSIWRIVYDFQDASSRIEVVVPDLGVVGPRAVACTSLGDYFRAPEGVYKFNGDWAQKISAKLDPVFSGSDTENYGGEAAAYRINSALGFHAGRLWVSYTWGGGTQNNDSFVYHVETDRWFSRYTGIGAFFNAGASFLGAGAVYVQSLEGGYGDDGAGTAFGYQSAYEDCGAPDHEKSFADLVVDHYTGDQILTVSVRTNKSRTAADVFDLDTTLQSSALTRQIIPLVYPALYSVVPLRGKPIRALNLSIRIAGFGPSAAPGISIETPLILHYYLEARRALVFDTDETDHGMPGVVKLVDEVEFDIDSTPGPGVLQIYSDIPGGAMAARLAAVGLAIAQTNGRATVRIVLPAPIDGRLLRYVATTTTGFSVYGFRCRLTPVGVFVDGAIAETWDTRPIPIAG